MNENNIPTNNHRFSWSALKCFVRGLWWVIATIALAPLAMPILALLNVFEFCADWLQKIYDYMCDTKHQYAPPPPYSMPDCADNDL